MSSMIFKKEIYAGENLKRKSAPTRDLRVEALDMSSMIFEKEIYAGENLKRKSAPTRVLRVEALDLVPLTGLEPVWHCCRGILSPLCLPISPQRHYDVIYFITNRTICQVLRPDFFS